MLQLIKINDAEAAEVGVSKDTPCEGPEGWGTKILPVLRAKGVPDSCLEMGAFKSRVVAREDDGVVFAVTI